ncbi:MULTISPECIES: PQQ-binding-like beta-propeller repeat protein [unclassified Brevibacterium]|uniref:outer membrane protein assembly factor BamB family protein n=1 Tax=unclassified Brevibacterium TaxID=2614124 RepID=UPI0010FA5216|nr:MULTISPECIES: PQQ-binding-like beta-propeller repeat protein [unclassified Brevibacterium]MCM1011327.1 PQQ-like beta-propeller repeat protein [Brevibacterium sp. XM4083]
MTSPTRRPVLALVAVALLLAGCTPGRPSADPAPTPTTTPELAEPIELDYPAALVVDDGVGRALVTDWTAQKLRAIDAQGTELWSMDAVIDDERGGAEAYSAGDSVIVHDYTGTTTAYAWADGSEQWSYAIPGDARSCHRPESFGSQTTGVSPHLGEGDLLLLTYLGVADEPGCTPTSEDGSVAVIALDPTTGKEAWPALSTGPKARMFGGIEVNISPDRTVGYLSFADGQASASADGEDSVLSRIDLSTGANATVSLDQLRKFDDSGADSYDVYPTSDPEALIYVYGAEDPDDPFSSMITRAADLTVSEGLEPTDGTVLQVGEGAAAAAKTDTTDPVCAADLRFTAAGQPTCVETELFASAIKYQGSEGGPQGWFADAPETALDVVGLPGAPQSVPVDAGERALVVVPGLDTSVLALDAATGETAWTAGAAAPRAPVSATAETVDSGPTWGGQGVLPELGLVVVTDAQTTSFYDAATGRTMSEHPAPEFATLTSGSRFALVSGDRSTTMWAVVDR